MSFASLGERSWLQPKSDSIDGADQKPLATASAGNRWRIDEESGRELKAGPTYRRHERDQKSAFILPRGTIQVHDLKRAFPPSNCVPKRERSKSMAQQLQSVCCVINSRSRRNIDRQGVCAP